MARSEKKPTLEQQQQMHLQIRIIVVNINCGNKVCFCVKVKLSQNTISVLSLVYVCVYCNHRRSTPRRTAEAAAFIICAGFPR